MPTDVAFHTGLPDKLAYAERLLRQAWRHRRTVLVRGPSAQLDALDRALWQAVPGDFVPHGRLRDGQRPAPRLARTPIWLADPGADAPDSEVLLNLGPEPVPAPDAAREARIVELVDRSDDDGRAGRARWRQWQARGVEPTHRPSPGAAA